MRLFSVISRVETMPDPDSLVNKNDNICNILMRRRFVGFLSHNI